jgi:cellobiose-specific phosphotransferase system component IIC
MLQAKLWAEFLAMASTPRDEPLSHMEDSLSSSLKTSEIMELLWAMGHKALILTPL